jgi:hypothetical protein
MVPGSRACDLHHDPHGVCKRVGLDATRGEIVERADRNDAIRIDSRHTNDTQLTPGLEERYRSWRSAMTRFVLSSTTVRNPVELAPTKSGL